MVRLCFIDRPKLLAIGAAADLQRSETKRCPTKPQDAFAVDYNTVRLMLERLLCC